MDRRGGCAFWGFDRCAFGDKQNRYRLADSLLAWRIGWNIFDYYEKKENGFGNSVWNVSCGWDASCDVLWGLYNKVVYEFYKVN